MKSQFLVIAAALVMASSASRICVPAEANRAVPVNPPANIAGAGGSFMPSFSDDGHLVCFVSFANNLVTNDNLAPYLDVFVRDMTTSNATLVSVKSSGIGGGNGNSSAPSISSNGQFVVFESAAGDLGGNDTNGLSDVFVRDLIAGMTTLVSVNTSGMTSRNGVSTTPLISADGRWVVFESTAPDLVTNQTSTLPYPPYLVQNVYARDMVAGVTVLVSVDQTGAVGGNAASDVAGMTPDGRSVAFTSASTNLAAGVNATTKGEIYVRDLQTGLTILASMNMAGILPGYTGSMNPALSRDARSIVFQAVGGTATNLYRFDLQSQSTTMVSTNVQDLAPPALSADGRFIAYEKDNFVYVWDGQLGTNILASISPGGSTMTNTLGSSQPVMTPDGSKVLFLSADSRADGSVQLYVRDLPGATTLLVSATTNGTVSTDPGAILPAISSDGNLVAFESFSDQLVADDLNQASDVFVRDLKGSTTQLISQRHPALPAQTSVALCGLSPNAISADGRFIVFSSLDNNLVPGDTNGWQDVFVHDFVKGTNLAVSVSGSNAFGTIGILTNTLNAHDPIISANGKFVAYVLGSIQAIISPPVAVYWRDLENGITQPVPPNYAGSSPSISPDGRLVAFQSSAPGSELAPGISDANFASDVFVRDMIAATNELISVNLLGTGAGNGASSNALFSPDGRWILFASTASNLTTNNTAGILSLFARSLLSNTTELVSVGTDGNPQMGFKSKVVFSGDSRFVAFVSANSAILVRDLQLKTSTQVCTGCDNPSLSTDGRLVAFETPISGGTRQIVLKDLQTGLTNPISVNRLGTGGGNGDSSSPLISGDGRFVVFSSKASDLVENDTNNAADIFVRDRLQGATLLVSLNRLGNGPGNAVSSRPVLAADGRTVVFQSFATDLVSGDYNNTRDIFVLRLDAIDSVLTLTSLNGGSATILWSAVPGRSYQVQFKNSLSDLIWSNLLDPVTATSSTASLSDNSAGSQAQRFYRVVVQ